MIVLDDNLLDKLTVDAANNPRLRINYNLHQSLDEPVQRLLNAMEPGTVLPIHRHKNTAETYLVLRGKLDVHVYNDEKEFIKTYHLDPLKGNYGLHMPAYSWHTVEVMESGTVIFELKEGPYMPLEGDDVMEV